MNDSDGVVGDEGDMGNLKDKFIHLTGSVPADCPGHDVALVKRFVAGLAEGILRNGGGLVVLVNKGEPNSTIPFDWDAIEAAVEFETVFQSRRVLLRTVRRSDYQSALSEEQLELLGRIARNTEDQSIPARDWTGGTIRRQQLQQADAAIIIGGSKGVEDTAKLMRKVGKPVLPLNFHVGSQPQETGGARLYEESLANPGSYMPRTHRAISTQTDALHVRDDTSAERVASEVVSIIANEMRGPSLLRRVGRKAQTAYRKSDPVLNIIFRANAGYNLSGNIPL